MTKVYDDVYVEDIADMICKNAENSHKINYDDNDKRQITDCLYWIKAAAENTYNSDYWRVFFKSLQDMHLSLEMGY